MVDVKTLLRDIRIGLFMKTPDGRIGVVTATQFDGGVFRGHCNLWFGEMDEGIPVTASILVEEGMGIIETPLGF